MRVRELISRLSTYDPETVVAIEESDDEGCTYPVELSQLKPVKPHFVVLSQSPEKDYSKMNEEEKSQAFDSWMELKELRVIYDTDV